MLAPWGLNCKTPRRSVKCQAGKGAKYYEYFKRNRAPHEGTLLPRPPGTISLLPMEPLIEYLQQEVWAYTTGQPSPTQALAGRPLGAKPSLQELLVEEQAADSRGGPALQGISGRQRSKSGRPGAIIPPPATLEGPGTHQPPTLKIKPYPQDQARVHVFWDLEAHHPGRADPRVLAHHIRTFASCYGQVAGVYAYAVRKAFNWVPEAFLSQAQFVGEGEGVLDGPVAEEREDMAAANFGEGRRRCPLCGTTKRSERELHAHMQLLHPGFAKHFEASSRGHSVRAAAPGLSSSRRGGGTGSAAQMSSSGSGSGASTERSSNGSDVSNVSDASTERVSGKRMSNSSAASLSSTTPSSQSATNVAAASAAPSVSQGKLWARNTSLRTLGKVLLYHNSLGQPHVPPVGHQLSLKYSLMQEGVETRIVQNSAERAASAMVNGMNRLLDRMRRGEIDTGVQTIVIVISDDEERFQKPLLRLRGMGGAATIAVCNREQSDRESLRGSMGDESDSGVRYRGADCVASWRLLAEGAYSQ